MYMGVILDEAQAAWDNGCAPHVYGGDPKGRGR